MGFMINKTTYEIQTCPSEQVMIDNGWGPEEWAFVVNVEDFSEYSELNAKITRQNNQSQKVELQSQIDLLERIAGVRAFREYMISIGQYGVVTSEYPNGKTLDLNNKIADLRVKIAAL